LFDDYSYIADCHEIIGRPIGARRQMICGFTSARSKRLTHTMLQQIASTGSSSPCVALSMWLQDRCTKQRALATVFTLRNDRTP
jgi:hypothetical protein